MSTPNPGGQSAARPPPAPEELAPASRGLGHGGAASAPLALFSLISPVLACLVLEAEVPLGLVFLFVGASWALLLVEAWVARPVQASRAAHPPLAAAEGSQPQVPQSRGSSSVLTVLGFLEGCLWGLFILLVPLEDPVSSYALATLVAAFCFVRLGAQDEAGRSGVPPAVPPFLAQAWVFATRGLPHALPVLAAWVLLAVLVWAVRRARGAAPRGGALEEGVHRQELQNRWAAEQHALLDALGVGVLITRAGRVEDCNAKLLSLFGYTRDALIGSDSRVLAVDEGAPSEAEWADAARKAGEPAVHMTRRRHRDGSIVELEVSVGLVEPGDPQSPVVSVFEDVTDRLFIERELRLSRERLHLALDALQSGVWDVDLNEARFFFSRRFKSILGFDVNTRLSGADGRLFFHHEFVHPEDRAAVADARMALLLTGVPLDAQYRVVRDARTFWVRETVVALLDVEHGPYRFTGSITDTTIINAIQERLRASEAFHRNLIEASNALIWCSDLAGILTFVNERGARELYGYESSQMIGRPYSEFVAEESRDRLALALIRPLKQGSAIRNLEVVHINSTQHRIFVSINAVPMYDALGRVEGVMGIATDITHLKKRERAFQDATRLQRLIFDSAGEGIVLVRNQRIYRANQAFADLVGATIGELVARPLSQCFVDGEQWEGVERQLAQMDRVIKVEQQLAHSTGAPLWASITGRCAEMAEHGSIYIWVFADISQAKAQEEQSWHRANHDELTGLANRRLLRDRLEQIIARARRESGHTALLMLDLDGFKAVNDAHGHGFGDEVLKEVANRLADNVRSLDIAARLGGDEFVLVLHEAESVQDVALTAQRLIDAIGRPIRIGDREVTIGASIGVAMFPETAGGIGALMQSADMAMYAAKAQGRGRFHFGTASTVPAAVDRIQED